MIKDIYKGKRKNYCKCGCGTLVHNNYARGHNSKVEKLEWTDEMRKAHSKLMTENNGFAGKTHSEESKQKMRESSTGAKWSEETRAKILAIRKS